MNSVCGLNVNMFKILFSLKKLEKVYNNAMHCLQQIPGKTSDLSVQKRTVLGTAKIQRRFFNVMYRNK